MASRRHREKKTRRVRRMRGGQEEGMADGAAVAPEVPVSEPPKTLRQRAAELPLIGRLFAETPQSAGRHRRGHKKSGKKTRRA